MSAPQENQKFKACLSYNELNTSGQIIETRIQERKDGRRVRREEVREGKEEKRGEGGEKRKGKKERREENKSKARKASKKASVGKGAYC